MGEIQICLICHRTNAFSKSINHDKQWHDSVRRHNEKNLTEDQKTIIEMRNAGRKFEDIAAVLGTTKQNVFTQYYKHRGKIEKLKKTFHV